MRLFVYGTLKRGQRNHDRFCRGLLHAEEATVVGRLYHLPVGYPMLTVPPAHILGLGTADYVGDEQRELRLCDELAIRANPTMVETSVVGIEAGWERIAGEIFTFDDPAARFPKLDRLEQFVPGGASFYDRVLIRPLSPATGVLWTYVASGGRLPEGAELVGSCWP